MIAQEGEDLAFWVSARIFASKLVQSTRSHMQQGQADDHPDKDTERQGHHFPVL